MVGGLFAWAAPFCWCAMPYEIIGLKDANRQVRELLRECHELLERSSFLLKQTKQDNEAPK